MNKKIKVIDLIDKKYHNLELPKNIIINRMKYYYDIGIGTYYDENEEKMTLDFTNNVLNMEVEILEDNTEKQENLGESWKEVGKRVGEWAKEFEQGFKESFTKIVRYPFEKLEDNTEEIEELDEWVTRRDGEVTQQEGKRLEMCYKINELVKAVKEMRKEKNNV